MKNPPACTRRWSTACAFDVPSEIVKPPGNWRRWLLRRTARGLPWPPVFQTRRTFSACYPKLHLEDFQKLSEKKETEWSGGAVKTSEIQKILHFHARIEPETSRKSFKIFDQIRDSPIKLVNFAVYILQINTQKIQTGKIKSPKIGKNQKNLTNNLGFFSWAEGIKKIEKQEGDEFWRDCK